MMKYSVLLLIALAAMVPSSMALRNGAIHETEFDQEEQDFRELGKSKGSKGAMMKSKGSKGKGKGKGKYHPPPPPPCEPKNPLVLYADDLAAANVLQIDPHCEKDDLCVGSFIPFKAHLYFDKHLSHKAGKALGHCTIVGFHDHVPSAYCLFSFIWDYYEECSGEHIYAEMAAAGVSGPTFETSKFLGTATAGILKDLEYPAIAETVLDGGVAKYEILGEFPDVVDE